MVVHSAKEQSASGDYGCASEDWHPSQTLAREQTKDKQLWQPLIVK